MLFVSINILFGKLTITRIKVLSYWMIIVTNHFVSGIDANWKPSDGAKGDLSLVITNMVYKDIFLY